jgi:hypothetical protein
MTGHLVTEAGTFLPGPPGAYCCSHCERARRRVHPPSLPTADYLAERDKLQAVTSDGELDPRRLHGPDLARWQVQAARAERGPDLDAWLAPKA